MMRSMFAGVTGLRNHQIRMDVIGSNIANVNTIGFKASRVNFQEAFSQTIKGASAPSGSRGGTNPQQIGLGMTIAGVDVLHTQGNLQPTGLMTDLAIERNGFFILRDASGFCYTRAGNFDLDAEGYLTAAGGRRVQGWMAQNGIFGEKNQNTLTNLRIPVGEVIGARATANMTMANNIDSREPVGTTLVRTIDVYDSLGNSHYLVITFEKTDVNEWSWKAEWGPDVVGSGSLQFTTEGKLSTALGDQISFTPEGANQVEITVDFSRITQCASGSSVAVIDRNGNTMGTLEGFTIDSSGVITGVYSNGLTERLAQVGLAAFANPGGLMKRGENTYEASNNSGIPQIGEAGTGGRGTVAPGALEMSSVDLSLEFTSMIVTQRGFQANSRIITTSDEMLQELVNLKR